MNEMDQNLEIQEKKKRVKRIWKLFVFIALTSFVFIFTTYAWFIGVNTVHISNVSVNVEGMDGLKVAINNSGTFSDSVTINSTNYNASGNSPVNSFALTEGGIFPLSSIGEFQTSGHLKIFKNTSISATVGGYKIKTDAVANTANDAAEAGHGYVVFDLYVKNTTNTSGTDPSLNYLKEEGEDIYLTVDSEVTSTPVGGSTPDVGAGIEDSVRVGFYEVSYIANSSLDNAVSAAAKSALIDNLSCTSVSGSKITGLCTNTALAANQSYLWHVWEPNDLAHLDRGISSYNSLCRERSNATTITTTACKDIDAAHAYGLTGYINTYAVKDAIGTGTNVINYDGHNTYFSSAFLSTVDTYKDSANTVADVSDPYSSSVVRAPFLRLAPNSVTKVRVYIWLEGQDIDSVDFSGTVTRLISVKFGLTKDKYEIERPSSGSGS